MTVDIQPKKLTPNDNLFSILGIMNGFQYSLVLSQEDLHQSLTDTLEFLNSTK